MIRRLPAVVLSLSLLTPGLSGCKNKAEATANPEDPPATAAPSTPAAEEFAAEAEHIRAGWVGTIHKAPKTFQELAKTSAGWAKFFKGEVKGAVESFRDSMEETDDKDPAMTTLRIGLGRSLLEAGALLRSNGQFHVRLLKEYFDTRAKRRAAEGVVKPSERLFHGISSLLSGDTEVGLKHLESVITLGDTAKPWLGQALAWKGFADKDRKESWRLARAEGPEAADWVLYLKCRAGLEGALPEGGSPMRDRLKVATLACRGQADEALKAAEGIPAKAPDQTDTIPALTGDAGAGEAELKYFSPVLLGELGRAWLLQADKSLEQMVGCPAYWRGRVKEALGDTAAAAAAYRAVGDQAPELDFACTLFSEYPSREDLRFDGERRAEAIEGKPPAQADDKRLIRRAWRLAPTAAKAGHSAGDAGGAKLLAVLADIPEDDDDLSTPLERALAEDGTADGRGLAVKVRGLQIYANGVLRAKARVAAAVGEHPLALKLLQATHDNQKTDRVSPVNRPGYLLDLGLALWNVKQRRPAVVYMQELSGRFPELWQNVEFMNRVDAIFAVGGGDAPVQGQ